MVTDIPAPPNATTSHVSVLAAGSGNDSTEGQPQPQSEALISDQLDATTTSIGTRRQRLNVSISTFEEDGSTDVILRGNHGGLAINLGQQCLHFERYARTDSRVILQCTDHQAIYRSEVFMSSFSPLRLTVLTSIIDALRWILLLT